MRKTFEKSRALEYFSEKELSMQMGKGIDGWAAMLIKELIDNSLDACETLGVKPIVIVTIEKDYFCVADNGGGIPRETIEGSLNYLIRVSSNDAYIAPSRGRLGNALKLCWAAPFVIFGNAAAEVWGGGYHHSISIEKDPLTGDPLISHSAQAIETEGTKVKIQWRGIGNAASCQNFSHLPFFTLERICSDFCRLNPNLTIELRGEYQRSFPAIDPEWRRKWGSSDPGSIYWYSLPEFESLIRTYLQADREKGTTTTLRDFLSEFDGFSGSGKRKAVGAAIGLNLLKDLISPDGTLDRLMVAKMMESMKENAKPVKPDRVSRIGTMPGEYAVRKGEIRMGDAIVPAIVECCLNFGEFLHPMTIGLNHSFLFSPPGAEFQSILAKNYLRDDEIEGQLHFLVHISHPKLQFSDKGKQSLILDPELKQLIADCVAAAAKPWRKICDQKKRSERAFFKENKREAQKLTVRAAAYAVIPDAYYQASSGGTLPANARQIMYAARPGILRRIGGSKFSDQYFTQVLLPQFQADHPELTKNWKVAYDPRGHLTEPHTRKTIGLGTLNVEGYVSSWRSASIAHEIQISDSIDTIGPSDRYQAVLFVEKEGFNSLFEAVKLAERWDIAIMSTKGMSVTASRSLIESFSDRGIPIFFLHDFDEAGLTILKTAQTDTRRYKFRNTPKLIDIGIRLKDVDTYNLDWEPFTFRKNKDPREGLKAAGASQEEIDFLCRGCDRGEWHGRRVEINALNSEDLVHLIESDFEAHGLTKLVPDAKTIEKAYLQIVKIRELNKMIQQAEAELGEMNFYIPPDLTDRLTGILSERPYLSWDAALKELCSGGLAMIQRDLLLIEQVSNG